MFFLGICVMRFPETIISGLHDGSHSSRQGFLCGSIFKQTAFCLGEKQGILVNNECSSCYSRVGNFLYQLR